LASAPKKTPTRKLAGFLAKYDPAVATIETLRQAVGAAPVDEATLRRVLREELKAG
jgi:hypothetical protein